MDCTAQDVGCTVNMYRVQTDDGFTEELGEEQGEPVERLVGSAVLKQVL